MVAAAHNYTPLVEKLVKAGANVNLRSEHDRETALCKGITSKRVTVESRS